MFPHNSNPQPNRTTSSNSHNTPASTQSNPFINSFTDPDYFKRLPRYRKNFCSRIDETKTLLFRLGRNPVYTDEAFLYIGHQNGKPYFCNVENINDAEPRKIEFDSDLKTLLSGNVIEEIKRVGWIVLDGSKWGFLLDLSCLEDIYKGQIPVFWQRLLKFDFFIEQFRRFSFYYQQELNTELKEIPSTEIDDPIPDSFCPLTPKLFLHQRQEVGWMFKLENDPILLIPGKVKAIPFLDSGYYLDPKDNTKLIKEVTKAQINMPGGILASQVGSGKTISMIGLLMIGTHLRDVEEEKTLQNDNKYIEEQKKNSDEQTEEKALLENLNVILKGRYDPSLIIVTKNILYQWKQELEDFAPGLRVFVLEKWEQIEGLHFTNESKEIRIKDYDVILTHRKMIEEGNKMFPKHCPQMYKVNFKRVIFDEFHELISQSLHQQELLADKAKGVSQPEQPHAVQSNDVLEVVNMKEFACCLKNFQREFTWGVTGTPDNLEFHKHTKILFNLLNLNQQYNNINIYQALRNAFVKRFMRSNPCKVSLKPLEKSLQRVSPYQIQNLLYKGKLNYATNEKEAQLLCSHLLPQYRSLENEPDNIELAAEAIELRHQDELKKIETKLKDAKDENTKKTLEDRKTALEEEGNFYLEMSQMLMKPSFDCPICYMTVDNEKLVVTGCIHQVCINCYNELIKSVQNPQCMLCKDYLIDNELIIHPRYRGKKENKLTVIEKAIQETPLEDKIIIYTQFHSLVGRLEEIFTLLNIRYIVLRGQPSEINIALNKFKSIPDIKILLMSIEQSASGINVTAANHVFFAHPIFGMSFEKAALTYNQCIGRAHRIGQNKKVYAKLFVTSESLEDDMVPRFYKY